MEFEKGDSETQGSEILDSERLKSTEPLMCEHPLAKAFVDQLQSKNKAMASIEWVCMGSNGYFRASLLPLSDSYGTEEIMNECANHCESREKCAIAGGI